MRRVNKAFIRHQRRLQRLSIVGLNPEVDSAATQSINLHGSVVSTIWPVE
jgi:hypothetical protein